MPSKIFSDNGNITTTVGMDFSAKLTSYRELRSCLEKDSPSLESRSLAKSILVRLNIGEILSNI